MELKLSKSCFSCFSCSSFGQTQIQRFKKFQVKNANFSHSPFFSEPKLVSARRFPDKKKCFVGLRSASEIYSKEVFFQDTLALRKVIAKSKRKIARLKTLNTSEEMLALEKHFLKTTAIRLKEVIAERAADIETEKLEAREAKRKLRTDFPSSLGEDLQDQNLGGGADLSPEAIFHITTSSLQKAITRSKDIIYELEELSFLENVELASEQQFLETLEISLRRMRDEIIEVIKARQLQVRAARKKD